MLIIKYCMILIIFIISMYIGKYVAQKYRYRLEELEEIKNALNIVKAKIKFTYEPLPEIFKEISKNTQNNISKIFQKANENMNSQTASNSWEEAVDDYSGYLNKGDKQTIKTLSKLLRYNRCRWAIKPNRNNRKFFRRTNKTSTRRKK